jgi:hypothetical protein
MKRSPAEMIAHYCEIFDIIVKLMPPMKKLKNIRNRIFKILHSGKEHYCLFCHRTYGKFLYRLDRAEDIVF